MIFSDVSISSTENSISATLQSVGWTVIDILLWNFIKSQLKAPYSCCIRCPLVLNVDCRLTVIDRRLAYGPRLLAGTFQFLFISPAQGADKNCFVDPEQKFVCFTVLFQLYFSCATAIIVCDFADLNTPKRCRLNDLALSTQDHTVL